MAESEWYYKLDDGKARGPVTMSFLQTAYAQGKLRSRHTIRFRESGDWKAANSFRQMVKAREKYQKLLKQRKSKKKKTGLPGTDSETDVAIEAPTEVPSSSNDELKSDPWYDILITLFKDANLMPEEFDPEERVWFMWVGRKLGPFSFYDLVKMGHEGTLKVTDWVSHADSTDWTPLSPESEAAAAADQSAGVLSDSHAGTPVSDSDSFALSESNLDMPLSGTDSDAAGLSDSWVLGGDAGPDSGVDSGMLAGDDSGMASTPDYGAAAADSGMLESEADSGTYGMPDAPEDPAPAPQAPQPAGAGYRRKVKAAPPKLPDQVPTPALAEPEEEDEPEDDQANATALVAAQLLAGSQKTGVPPGGVGGGGAQAGGVAAPGGGAVGASGPPITNDKPLKERVEDHIKNATPRDWAVMVGGAVVVLYVLNFLISLIPVSNSTHYQVLLDVYAEAKALRDATAPNAAWEDFINNNALPRLRESLVPISSQERAPGSGAHFLFEGGRGLLEDVETRRVTQADYTPWFLQDLKKAADELGYTPPEGIPPGTKPDPAAANLDENGNPIE